MTLVDAVLWSQAMAAGAKRSRPADSGAAAAAHTPPGLTSDNSAALDRFACTPQAVDILRRLSARFGEGLDSHALQAQPHLVLLQADFYHEHLKPLLGEWAAMYLATVLGVARDTTAFVTAAPTSSSASARGNAASRRALLRQYLRQYVCGAPVTSRAARFVATVFSSDSVQHLNLARDWLGVYLPHVLAKVNRVSFGLLWPDDLIMLGQAQSSAGASSSTAHGVPPTRRYCAVPFVGKDTPSASSEFANRKSYCPTPHAVLQVHALV